VLAPLPLAILLLGCSQLTSGEQQPATPDPPPVVAPVPGPDATPGCQELTEPVQRLVVGVGQERSGTEEASAEVRRLAAGVEDNALSAVASRLSGLATQPTVDPAALDSQWEQFRRLCDLD
jgi:hypothetical protein